RRPRRWSTASCSCRRRSGARRRWRRTRTTPSPADLPFQIHRAPRRARTTETPSPMAEPAATFAQRLRDRFPGATVTVAEPRGEVTLEVSAGDLLATCFALRDELGFEQLIDLCGIDYMGYGSDEWDTDDVSSSGFSRGVEGK